MQDYINIILSTVKAAAIAQAISLHPGYELTALTINPLMHGTVIYKDGQPYLSEHMILHARCPGKPELQSKEFFIDMSKDLNEMKIQYMQAHVVFSEYCGAKI